MAKVKVFVYATNTDADADGRAMTLAPRTFVLALLKRKLPPRMNFHINRAAKAL